MGQDETAVSHLLGAAGFTPPAHEVAELEADYATLRGMVALLYTVAETRYESPALGFDPDPRFADWA